MRAVRGKSGRWVLVSRGADVEVVEDNADVVHPQDRHALKRRDPVGQLTRRRATTGIVRTPSRRRSYSPNPGIRSTCIAKIRSRAAPVISRTVTRNRSV